MSGFTVKAVDGKASLYGKTANDLQSNIVIGDSSIKGNLKYVTEFTEFNPSDPNEQEGNFLALSVDADPEATIASEFIGGKHPEPVDLTEDKYCVYKITDKDTQKIKITVEKDEDSSETTYDLSGLRCASK